MALSQVNRYPPTSRISFATTSQCSTHPYISWSRQAAPLASGLSHKHHTIATIGGKRGILWAGVFEFHTTCSTLASLLSACLRPHCPDRGTSSTRTRKCFLIYIPYHSTISRYRPGSGVMWG